MYSILVTGAKGFVGKNLIVSLEAIRDGKDRGHRIEAAAEPSEIEILEYDLDSTPEQLDEYCSRADFVFHLAGVNRPKDPQEFLKGNYGFSSELLNTLEKYGNTCPVMLASSIQATMIGRYLGSEYGRSKLAGEVLFSSYGSMTGARVLIYRFPNLFGKWCRPNYNSAVATFCYNTAHDLPIRVDDPKTRLDLVYIDDVVEELLSALNGQEHRCNFDGLMPVPDAAGRYCYVPQIHTAALGEIVSYLELFKNQPKSLMMPEIAPGSFAKKLYSTYLSYLPREKAAFFLPGHMDERGSFTELLKTAGCGQFSVNISKPGSTKGQHWHHTKWEFFIVVSGHGLIQERRLGTDENGMPYPVLEFEVSGERIEAVHMLPGYTHNIINLSENENLVTLMWANESLDPDRPDTFREEV